MESYGLIIHHLRILAGLSVRETAEKIGRSVGWLSEIENNCGTARITDEEFNRIVVALGGAKHRPMFKTWVASLQNQDRAAKTFDGAVLKFIRLRKELSIGEAAKRTGLSKGYLSKIENGFKAVDLELRNRIMVAYGYSPTSFKNLSTDPVRSKAVPLKYKLDILLNQLPETQIESVFRFVQELSSTAANS